MKKMLVMWGMAASLLIGSTGCNIADKESPDGSQKEDGEAVIQMITLDPGHFHAALVQKLMYPQISPIVHVYAPAGSEVESHLKLIEGFNSQEESPTNWEEDVYTGEDFFEKMLADKKGNLVVLAGNNKKKAEYIKACVDAGLNVLADKPMCINKAGYETLLAAFDSAKKNNVLIYDIMTERSEITTILQKELAQNPELSGKLVSGSLEEPAIVKESVHHFFKYVSGKPLQRPAWAFDTTQQGEGIVDVTNHLLDLIMWEAFPEQIITNEDIEILSAKRWPTMISREQFEKVTGVSEFPEYLEDSLNEKGELVCYANGQIDYKLKGIHSQAIVKWNYQAPEGAADTHYSIMRGSRANIIIRQGAEQNYKPGLFVEPAEDMEKSAVESALAEAIEGIRVNYPGVELGETANGWQVTIPDEFRIGHEAHFAQVMRRYLGYLDQGALPEWEESNMKVKYLTTTQALEKAMSIDD